MGPEAKFTEKRDRDAADEEGGDYQVLRPRNVPRRELRGQSVVDAYLDVSDSFQTTI